jgi:hypothetical protein
MVMSRDQNVGLSHSIKMDNSFFERVEDFKYVGTNNKPKFFLGRNEDQIEISECLLSFGAESYVFQFVTQKVKD